MNLNQLKYFNAVCTYKTVSGAAEYLHISQPSLSNAIKELEKEFGVKLFLRQYRGMLLTPEGELLFKMSKELLSGAEQIENIMGDLGKERKILRLGVPPMIGSVILPHIYSEFQPMHPDVRLEIMEGSQKELLEKLSDDLLDMIFMPHEKVTQQNLSILEIMQPEIVFCVSEQNSLSQKKSVSAKDLEDTPLILFKEGFFNTEEVKKWFAASNIKPNILLQTEQLSTLQSIVSNNVAAGFMLATSAQKKKGFAVIKTNPPMKVNVSLAWKENSYFSGCMKSFKTFMQNFATKNS
ncbi:MAG: LysR family transcriptional regulator [Clostridia bacterium]|nr:LysR family transcriptional regulator [Clostridia bacterium]